MSKLNFRQRLLNDLVVIEITEATPTRIQLPDWQRTLKGYVRAAGPGKMLNTGKRGPMACRVGDYVTFAATAGMDQIYAGHPIRTMHDTDVDALLKRAPRRVKAAA